MNVTFVHKDGKATAVHHAGCKHAVVGVTTASSFSHLANMANNPDEGDLKFMGCLTSPSGVLTRAMVKALNNTVANRPDV